MVEDAGEDMHYLMIVLVAYIVCLIVAPQQVLAITLVGVAAVMNLIDWTTVPY